MPTSSTGPNEVQITKGMIDRAFQEDGPSLTPPPPTVISPPEPEIPRSTSSPCASQTSNDPTYQASDDSPRSDLNNSEDTQRRVPVTPTFGPSENIRIPVIEVPITQSPEEEEALRIQVLEAIDREYQQAVSDADPDDSAYAPNDDSSGRFSDSDSRERISGHDGDDELLYATVAPDLPGVTSPPLGQELVNHWAKDWINHWTKA